MKKQLFAAVVGAALALPLFAQAQSSYVGVNAGRSELKLSGDLGSGKEDKTGYKAYAGYNFTQNFGLEAGYANFGKLKDRDAGTAVSMETSAFYLAGTATMPINQQFSAFAKAGVTQNRTKATVSGFGLRFSGKEDKTAAMFGIGAAYHVNQNVSVVAEYENFGKTYSENGAKLKASMLSAGVRYQF